MPYVIVTHNGEELTRRMLKRPLVVGRSDQADLQIHDRMLSRKHCRIEQTSRGWMIVDLDSHNGTVINGTRVHQHLLRDQQQIEVGDTVITFHAGAYQSNRPSDPREAVLRARMENEIDGSSDDTIGLSGRLLPTPKLKPAAAPRVARSVADGPPVAFARPQPTPQIAGLAKPVDDEVSSPPSLFGRLLGRRQ